MTFGRRGNAQNRFGASRKGHRKIEHDGFKWDSEAELHRYVYLRAIEREGEICDLRPKIPWSVTVNGIKIWRARIQFDFVYIDGGAGKIIPTAAGGWAVDGPGELKIEDWKGHVDVKSPEWGLFVAKARVVYAIHGVRVRVMTKTGQEIPLGFHGEKRAARRTT
jgi:hypothetical protein